ncbi:UDP-N-acetylglucosamine-peptide N-acetylglucosaminyltransferase [Pyricularia oryzae Y34]|uniref:protein O-GlcNAc transferase n=2 Tax=Pyricularia oryzae TaxID=318829 RepID=A0AA97P7U6_PYRO3|nr:UDP-N-acetylglucosamine-peptide N-acetylglucosaminyltransferase [Pyricularia oryzae Y34]
MLPLVQMHQMVPTPPHLDPHIDHLDQISPLSNIRPGYMAQRSYQRQQPRASNQYPNANRAPTTFPIRSSQAAQSPYHSQPTGLFNLDHTQRQAEHSQHQLRRKTPSGTIDAGYDGSPAGTFGPPPLKQLIIPANSKIYPTAFVQTCSQPASINNRQMALLPASNWHYQPQNQPTNFDSQPAGWNLGQAIQPDGSHLAEGNSVPYYPQHLYGCDPRLQNVFRPAYQQKMGSTAFNPAGFTPPPVWRDTGVSDYSRQVPLSNLGYIPQNAVVDAAYMPSQQSMHHPLMGNFFGQGSSMRGSLLSGFDPDPSMAQQLQNTLPSPQGVLDQLSPNGGHLGLQGDVSTPAQFKDKALSLAHKTYATLIDHLNKTKQAHYGKSMSGLKGSSKMVVFPTVPKQLVSSLNSRQISAAHTNSSVYVSSNQPNFSYAGKFYHAAGIGPLDLPSPVNGARHSLEMLTNLCEQSGWKWIDGMLLGGCLHYGLEHYEEALDWFQRIVNLEARHDEAEKHWLDAVNIRPAYLEAVEHLVGLLCSSQRSRQAVDIIGNVQQRLRMPQPGSSNCNDESTRSFPSPASASQPGFGSSGYMIPGHDNGRMLLLVHAKGNMLYALKDIEKASEAFEEVVMIAIGRKAPGIQNLIREIQAALSPRVAFNAVRATGQKPSPMLLPPEKAKRTADILFAGTRGQLPGLRYIGEGKHRTSTITTTSNSLLSLAKIFQDSMSSGGLPLGQGGQPSGVGDILALYYLSLSLQESPSTANNVGILLASVQQSSTQAEPLSAESAALVQHIPGIVRGSGLELALLYYQYGLTIDPNHVHLHTNLGSLLKDIGQLDMAIGMYERAVNCDGNFDIALTNLANAVKDRGRIHDAVMYYRRAVDANPNFAEAVCGLSTALNSVCNWKGRGGVYLYGGKFDRWHVDEDGMLRDVRQNPQGSGLMKRVTEIVKRQLNESSTWGHGTLQEAVIKILKVQLDKLVEGEFDLEAELRKWNGMVWEGSRILRLIERSTRVSMRKWYIDKYVQGRESPEGYARARLPGSLSVPTAPTVLPFHTFTCPLTAPDIRMISQRNAHRISASTLRSHWLPSTVYEPPPPPQPYLNVGYLSSDFNNHPLAHLMQSVFGLHDQSRVKAHCYATTASDKSIHRQQIEREAPVFRDVSNWSSERLVDQIARDNIHILVNLNGYTRGARNEIFAARPAPIQMSFMGFAGTLGAEWCDYLLADTTAVPPSTLRPYRRNVDVQDIFRDECDEDKGEWIYSENIIYCRDTFFCCDHAQSSDADDDRKLTWEDEQARRWKMRKEIFPNLPDDAIILGNFNQLYKIDPTTFRTWLRILSQVPKAVLWLLRFPELGECNLRNTARAWAGEKVASRIIFTDVAPKQQHISRARVCDLFLDTPECNAHTTAADILWSSTPLLTLPRYEYKMCSRMAASILKGALPKSEEGARAATELIASDEKDYEESAVRLANGLTYRPNVESGYGEGSGRLAELRKLLWDSKFGCALFDTKRWVRDLEDAYDEAWRRWVAGEGGDIYL